MKNFKIRKLFILGENNNHMIVCFGENSPKKDSNWVKCWELHSTAGSDSSKALGVGGRGAGGLLDIIETDFCFPLEDYSVSFVSTCLVEGVSQIVVSVRDLPLPVFTGGSWVHGHAGPWDRCGQTCVHTDSGFVRMFGRLGCVTRAEWAVGVPVMPSFIQGLANIVTMETLAFWAYAPFSILGSLLLLVQAKLRFSSHPAVPAAKRKRELPSWLPRLTL